VVALKLTHALATRVAAVAITMLALRLSLANEQLERVCAQFSYRDVTVIQGILRGWSASTATMTTATSNTANTGTADSSTAASTTASAELLTPPRTPQFSSKTARTRFNTGASSAVTASTETTAPVTAAPVTDGAGLYEVVFAEPVLGITLVKQGGMPIVEVRRVLCIYVHHVYLQSEPDVTHAAAT
jgi:hypothetical protein